MIKCSFMDNQLVGADDLNNLVKTLVGQPGVADPFADGESYYVSKLNDICYNNIGEGVLPDTDSSLQVTLSGTLASINAGKAIFANGMIAEVTGTETVSVASGTKNYIALCANIKMNTCELIASNDTVTDSEADGVYYVLLAEISDTNVLTDKRVYAKGKVASMYAGDFGLPGYTKIQIDSWDVNNPITEIATSIAVGSKNWMFVKTRNGIYGSTSDPRNFLGLSWIDLAEGSSWTASSLYLRSNNTSTPHINDEAKFAESTNRKFDLLIDNSRWNITAQVQEKDGKYVIALGGNFPNDKDEVENIVPITIEIFAM